MSEHVDDNSISNLVVNSSFQDAVALARRIGAQMGELDRGEAASSGEFRLLTWPTANLTTRVSLSVVVSELAATESSISVQASPDSPASAAVVGLACSAYLERLRKAQRGSVASRTPEGQSMSTGKLTVRKLEDWQVLLAYALGTIGGGIPLFVVGTALKSHFALNAAVCNTYGGHLTSCAGNEGLFMLGQFLQPLGVIAIVIGVVIGIPLVIYKSKNTTPGSRAPYGSVSGRAVLSADQSTSQPMGTSRSKPTTSRNDDVSIAPRAEAQSATITEAT